MTDWLLDVERLEGERADDARAKADALRVVSEGTAEWVAREVVPAMERFATDLRSIGRIVEVHEGGTHARVEVRDRMGILSEFTAEIGTEGEGSTKVRDRLPAMSQVFHGVERGEVKSDRIYEMLKTSYLAKIKSRPA